VTVTVILSSEEVDQIENQAKDDGISPTDAIRRSIQLGQVAWEASRRGAQLLLRERSGEIRTIDFRTQA
jgi:hypothetical protein